MQLMLYLYFTDECDSDENPPPEKIIKIDGRVAAHSPRENIKMPTPPPFLKCKF